MWSCWSREAFYEIYKMNHMFSSIWVSIFHQVSRSWNMASQNNCYVYLGCYKLLLLLIHLLFLVTHMWENVFKLIVSERNLNAYPIRFCLSQGCHAASLCTNCGMRKSFVKLSLLSFVCSRIWFLWLKVHENKYWPWTQIHRYN